jgi:hypothetical protein
VAYLVPTQTLIVSNVFFQLASELLFADVAAVNLNCYFIIAVVNHPYCCHCCFVADVVVAGMTGLIILMS